MSYRVWQTNTNILDGKEFSTRSALVSHLRSEFKTSDSKIVEIAKALDEDEHATVSKESRRMGTVLDAVLGANYSRETWNIGTGSVVARSMTKAVPVRDEVNDWIDDENPRPSDSA